MQSGQASLALVNDAVLRILTTMFRIGVFDTDYTPTSIPVAAHDAVARAVERKAITLLKNSGVLPLTAATKSDRRDRRGREHPRRGERLGLRRPDHRHADPAGHHRPRRVGRPGHVHAGQ